VSSKVLLALLLAAAPAFAQPVPGADESRRVPGVSDQGNTLLNQALNAPDQQLTAVMRQQRQVRDQLVAVANASTIDVDKVAALMKQREDLQSQYRQLADARLVNALRQLTPADRGPFMRALANPPAGGRPPQ